MITCPCCGKTHRVSLWSKVDGRVPEYYIDSNLDNTDDKEFVKMLTTLRCPDCGEDTTFMDTFELKYTVKQSCSLEETATDGKFKEEKEKEKNKMKLFRFDIHFFEEIEENEDHGLIMAESYARAQERLIFVYCGEDNLIEINLREVSNPYSFDDDEIE